MGPTGPEGREDEDEESELPHVYENFLLYETRARYYLVGYTRKKEAWRVLKISRMEGSALEVRNTLEFSLALYGLLCVQNRCALGFWIHISLLRALRAESFRGALR